VRMVDQRDGKRVPATLPGASVRGIRERSIPASPWRYLGYFARMHGYTDGTDVNYRGLRIRMDGVLAPREQPCYNSERRVRRVMPSSGLCRVAAFRIIRGPL
jgi:hypothetical protein